MIKVGIAGIGFMGMIHFLSYQKTKGVKVVALCEQDRTRLEGDWRAIKGNFGPRGEMMDLSGIAKFERLDEMIADPKIDLIDVCLPPAAHMQTTLKALQAGKHVFCEKPIALTSADANRMVSTAAARQRMLMIGHVLPFFPEYAYVHRMAASKKYGRLLAANFKRITADPMWLKHYYDPAIIGGPLLDLHIHDAHFIRLMFGMPNAVFSSGRMRGEVVEFFNSMFLFDDPSVSVTATSGAINQQGRTFTHGFEIHFEKATAIMDFSVIGDKPEQTMPLTILTANGKVERPELGSGDPVDSFAAEIAEVTKAVRSGKTSSILAGDLARDAVVLCNKQTESVKKGRLVKI
jgi:predicted dehydrogenase